MDCGFEGDGIRFRYRAAAVIVEDGKVLLMRNGRDPYLYTVGGAVNLGETSRDAAERECLEETGVAYRAARLAAVEEVFFEDDTGSGCPLGHEVGLFYIMEPRGTTDGVVEVSNTDGMDEFPTWVALEDLGGIDVIPRFLGEMISSEGVMHVVHHPR